MSALMVGSLFSGIGGLDLGLERAGMKVIWQSEIDPYASRVLAKHWPTVPNLGDITTIDWSTVERPDVICGGYPCPPFSQAGHQLGHADPRNMWPYMRDAIAALRPRFAILENVAAHLRVGFDRVLGDLAELGFDAEWSLIRACSVGASHTRARLFVVAYPQGADAPSEVSRRPFDEERRPEPGGGRCDQSRPQRWLPEPALDRMADGVSRRVVRGPLHALGNAVVPQVSEVVGRRIVEAAGAVSVTEDTPSP